MVDYFIDLARTIGVLTDPYISPLENVLKTTLNSTFPQVYQNLEEILENNKSPFVDKLPLMNLFHVLIITIGYLSTIYIGKMIMSNRDKVSVKWLSIMHNLNLVVLSAYMCVTVLSEAWRRGYSLFANADDRSEEGFQKNNHQISFLHVYHHFSIFIIWWWVTYVAPTGEAYFSAALNSAVHVVMYGYYLSTVLSVPIRFLKKYITLFQMTQFSLNMIQASWDLFYFKIYNPTSNSYPFSSTILLWFYMWTMLGLFADFFRKDRKREKEQSIKKKGQ
ncbi:5893_t:CDS:2 [Diversispora eburnea]|uniref:Elongation of fatty acids protein n=1 Tax=Diversispora eburnea TaxID=1213867 RepID=A0A9N9ATP0_9GLOM|nr:5893_t:CDS:2 [Diversispora eburnea]